MFFDNIYWNVMAVVPLVLMGIGYWKQNLILYCNHTPAGSIGSYVYLPSRYNLLFEDVYIKTKDNVTLHCWFLRGPRKLAKHSMESAGNLLENASDDDDTASSSSQHSQDFSHRSSNSSTMSLEFIQQSFNVPTIIYFHGNAGNISHRLLKMKEMFRHGIRCNVFMVEYRGYGKSGGTPSEAGLRLDAEAALLYILSRSDINTSNVFIYGVSLGGAVAIDLYQKYQHVVRGCIIENTFLSVDKMINHLFHPLLRWLKYLSRNKWNSEAKIANLNKEAPILFLAGDGDEIVPHEHMKLLYQECPSRHKHLKVFRNATHNETWMQMRYFHFVKEFVEKYGAKMY